jgi:hypothetical protein
VWLQLGPVLTVDEGEYQGRPFEREYGLALVSYTPLSTNVAHVRYILVDVQLGDNVEAYRSEITDEETAEALRRSDAGVRVVNIEGFARSVIDGEWRLVYSGTRQPVAGTEVVFTIDGPE